MRRTVTSPILPLKILLLENDPAVAEEIRLTLVDRSRISEFEQPFSPPKKQQTKSLWKKESLN
jgi:hypothetical protein